MSSDLLFISQDRMVRWDPLVQFGVALVENVRNFSADASGRSILMLRPRQVAANGLELFDLDMLDLQSKQITRLVEEIANIDLLSISPDGSWAAFHQSNRDGDVTVFALSDPETRLEIGTCQRVNTDDCQTLTWSPDSKSLLWIDSRGIWIAFPGKNSSDILNSGAVQVSDPKGEVMELTATFSGPVWSPAGRFVLVGVSPTDTDIRWMAVLDTRSKRMMQVIDSYEVTEMDASLTWLLNGDLVTAQANDPIQGSPAAVQLWKLIPTSEEMIIPQRLFQYSVEELFSKIEIDDLIIDPEQIVCLDWLQPMADGHLLVGMRTPAERFTPVLFDLDLNRGDLTAISQVGPGASEVLWALDNRGYLVTGSEPSVNYFELKSGNSFSLIPYEDGEPRNFMWLPPSPRR
jgi:hypothetical protein